MNDDSNVAAAGIDWELLNKWAAANDWLRLASWLNRNLDENGTPLRWPVSQWREILSSLDQLRPKRGDGWSEELRSAWDALLRSILRFSRPDGSAFFWCARFL